jgi:DNA-binding NarL/FixJ family response regulator
MNDRGQQLDPVKVKEPKPFGVVLAYPYPVVRAGLALLVASDERLQLFAQVGTPEETFKALTMHSRGRPLAVIVGTGFEGSYDSFGLIRAIRERFPRAIVVATASNADMDSVSRSLFVGADAFVDHIVRPAEFLTGIYRAALGETVLVGPPSEWLGPIADLVEQHREERALLTNREQEVLLAASSGGTARQIAQELGLRERTVTTHLGRIYHKLGVNSRMAAVSVAARRGLVALGP